MAQLLAEVVRPALGAAKMMAVIRYVGADGFNLLAVRLSVDVSLGVTSYVGIVLVLWLITGRPAGPESHLLSLPTSRMAKRPVAGSEPTAHNEL